MEQDPDNLKLPVEVARLTQLTGDQKVILAYLLFRSNLPRPDFLFNITDVARQTGCSKQTVSRFFRMLVKPSVDVLEPLKPLKFKGGVIIPFHFDPDKCWAWLERSFAIKTDRSKKEQVPSDPPSQACSKKEQPPITPLQAAPKVDLFQKGTAVPPTLPRPVPKRNVQEECTGKEGKEELEAKWKEVWG